MFISSVQFLAVLCCVVQYSTVQYSTVQYSTVQYSAVQYITTWQPAGASEGSSVDGMLIMTWFWGASMGSHLLMTYPPISAAHK